MACWNCIGSRCRYSPELRFGCSCDCHRSTWTVFRDRRTGGDLKTPFDVVAIEAPLDEALKVFERRFPDVGVYGESYEGDGDDFEVTERARAPRAEAGERVLWVMAGGTEWVR